MMSEIDNNEIRSCTTCKHCYQIKVGTIPFRKKVSACAKSTEIVRGLGYDDTQMSCSGVRTYPDTNGALRVSSDPEWFCGPEGRLWEAKI